MSPAAIAQLPAPESAARLGYRADLAWARALGHTAGAHETRAEIVSALRAAGHDVAADFVLANITNRRTA